MRFYDPGDGINNNGGSPTTIIRNHITVSWLWPSNCANPAYFEVVCYTGADASATSSYLFAPIQVHGMDRTLVTPISPGTSMTGINASVRAFYA